MEPIPIKEVMEKLHLSSTMSPKEVLSTLEHIQLTDDEVCEALVWRKQKKERELSEQALRQKEHENRLALTQTQWDVKMTDAFMKNRSNRLFDGKFIVDGNNSIIYRLMLQYFSQDPEFISIANELGGQNASLDKGLLLLGNCGVGKTWLVKLFARNQRQVYHVHNAREIASSYEASGEEGIDFVKLKKNAYNDSQSFFQEYAGLCIDDLGTEEVKSHYGNKKNVIGDIIERRYSAQNTGVFLHATTNFKLSQIKEFYGERVLSRMFEIFNFIELGGPDRRK